MKDDSVSQVVAISSSHKEVEPSVAVMTPLESAFVDKLIFYSWLKDIEEVLNDCHECLRLEAEAQQGGWFDVGRVDVQQRLSELHWFVLTTQLAKLFSNGKQQRLSFYRLSQYLRNSKGKPWLLQELVARPKARWKSIEEMELGLVEVHRMIGKYRNEVIKLNYARNTATAHTDPLQRDARAKHERGPEMDDFRRLTRQARRSLRIILLGFGFSTEPNGCGYLIWDTILVEANRKG